MKPFFPFLCLFIVVFSLLTACSSPLAIQSETTLPVQSTSSGSCPDCPCSLTDIHSNGALSNPALVSASPQPDIRITTQEPASLVLTPTPTEEPITLLPFNTLENAFFVDYERILVITRIENPNSFSLVMSPYQLALYDKTDVLVQSASGFIDLIPPQTTITLADVLLTPRKAQYNPQFFDISRVETIVSAGQPVYETEINPAPFEIPQVTFLQHDRFPRVSGLVKSNLSEDIRGIPVVTIIYDKEDQIIGGGMAYIPVLPAQSSAPIEIGVIIDRKKTFNRVELYPRLPLYSIMNINQGSN